METGRADPQIRQCLPVFERGGLFALRFIEGELLEFASRSQQITAQVGIVILSLDSCRHLDKITPLF